MDQRLYLSELVAVTAALITSIAVSLTALWLAGAL
jgi:hypothetical protein